MLLLRFFLYVLDFLYAEVHSDLLFKICLTNVTGLSLVQPCFFKI